MLKVLGYETLDALVDAAVPGSVRSLGTLDLPPAVSEHQVLDELRRLADENTIAEPMIGLGYSGTITPGVIRRNVLESPAWYTAYTPYQPEISQGRLEALLNFQTMVTDLTGLDTANASLLDESTAVAEAVTLMRRRATSESNRVIVDADCLPQTIAVLATRLGPLGLTLDVVDLGAGAPAGDYFGMVQQYPGCSGALRDFEALTAEAHAKGALVTVAADLLALTLLKPPGEWGADVAVGSSQRFGVPLWYGGPHAAFMAVKSRARARSAGTPGRALDRRGGAARPTVSPCRRGSSTSAGRRRPPTSAPPRCCWRSWPPCTPCTTAPRDCAASHAASTAAPSTWRPGCSSPASAWSTSTSSTPWSSRRTAGRRRSSMLPAGVGCSSASSTRTTSGSRAARRPRRPTLPPCSRPSGRPLGERAATAPCPRRSCAGARFWATPSSRSTTPRRPCCAICVACRTRTSRSIAA